MKGKPEYNKQEVKTEHLASDDEKLMLKIFVEDLMIMAKENFMADGTLSAAVFVGYKQDDHPIFGMIPVNDFMQNKETKNKLEELLQEISEKIRPICIVMIHEAWIVSAKIENPVKDALNLARINHEGVAAQPDKEEIVMGIFESENLQHSITLKIVREPELALVEDPLLNQYNKVNVVKGRFINFLKDKSKIKNN